LAGSVGCWAAVAAGGSQGEFSGCFGDLASAAAAGGRTIGTFSLFYAPRKVCPIRTVNLLWKSTCEPSRRLFGGADTVLDLWSIPRRSVESRRCVRQPVVNRVTDWPDGPGATGRASCGKDPPCPPTTACRRTVGSWPEENPPISGSRPECQQQRGVTGRRSRGGPELPQFLAEETLSMRWRMVLGALVVSASMCSQSFGLELLDRLLGLDNCCGGCGSCAQCAEPACAPCQAARACAPEPACCEPEPCCDPCGRRCDLFSGLRDLFKCNRCGRNSCGCEPACEPACETCKPACEPACAPSCEPSCRPRGLRLLRPACRTACQPSCEPACEPACNPCARSCRRGLRLRDLDILGLFSCNCRSCCDPCGQSAGCGCGAGTGAPAAAGEAQPAGEAPAPAPDPSAYLRRLPSINQAAF